MDKVDISPEVVEMWAGSFEFLFGEQDPMSLEYYGEVAQFIRALAKDRDELRSALTASGRAIDEALDELDCVNEEGSMQAVRNARAILAKETPNG